MSVIISRKKYTKSRNNTMECSLICLGGCDASKESIQYITKREGGGNAVVLVVGGAEESLEARPGAYRLTLRNRKGFVKLAIKSG